MQSHQITQKLDAVIRPLVSSVRCWARGESNWSQSKTCWPTFLPPQKLAPPDAENWKFFKRTSKGTFADVTQA